RLAARLPRRTMFGYSEPPDPLAAAEFLAILCAAVFTGAAIYINLVEHPARMSLDTRAAAVQWAPSSRPATLMQAPLAIPSFLAGCTAWFLGGGAAWLIAALLIGAVVPFTLIVIKPTNDKLLAAGRDLAAAYTRALLERWGRLHAVRSLFSVLSTVVMLWQLFAPDRYSAFAPVSRTTLAHFTSSLFT